MEKQRDRGSQRGDSEVLQEARKKEPAPVEPEATKKKPTTRVENTKPKYLIDTKRNEPLVSEMGRRPDEKPLKARLHENTQEKLVELKKKQVISREQNQEILKLLDIEQKNEQERQKKLAEETDADKKLKLEKQFEAQKSDTQQKIKAMMKRHKEELENFKF
jgi:hypothetical protein